MLPKSEQLLRLQVGLVGGVPLRTQPLELFVAALSHPAEGVGDVGVPHGGEAGDAGHGLALAEVSAAAVAGGADDVATLSRSGLAAWPSTRGTCTRYIRASHEERGHINI